MEKKKIKVWLQYPWRSLDSPYYKYLIENPSNEIEYLNIKKQKGVIIKKSKFFFSNFLKKSIRKSTRALNLPLPNAHLTRSNQKYGLIHCAHFIFLLANCEYLITDGGSIQEESLVFKKPCVLLRKRTERQEGLKTGINFLTKLNSNYTKDLIDKIENKKIKVKKFKNPYGEKGVSKKIVGVLG